MGSSDSAPARKLSSLGLIKQTESPWLILNPVTHLFAMKSDAIYAGADDEDTNANQ
jgi:hypothetical protein